MILWMGVMYCIFYAYDYFQKIRAREHEIALKIEKLNEHKNPEQKIVEKEEKPQKKWDINPPEELTQSKKDKKIQKQYKEILSEYKNTLSPKKYKKFEEETKYDVLLYDALMVSRDKDGTLLTKIEQEKWELYTEALKKILS